MAMDDNGIVSIMQSLSLNYKPAEAATKSFEARIASLNKELFNMKASAISGAKDINQAYSSLLGGLGKGTSGGNFATQFAQNNVILDQYGNILKTVKNNTSNLDKSFQNATNTAKQHGKAVEDVAKKYNVFGNEMQRRVSWFMTGGLFYGGIKAAKEAVQTISEVEMGVTEIARVMEDASFVFKDYRDELLQLGVDYGQTFDVVQDIALRWAQAGYNVSDSLENTKTSLLALNTAELDASNATESLIGIMAQWQLTSKDLPLILDEINKTADDFTVTSQDLVDGLLRSSGAAKIMGLSLEETISLLTVMREASGRTGREVGNALNSILSYVQRPSAIKAFESMGIQVFSDTAKTQFRNVMEIFQDIATKWPTLSAQIQDGFVKAADEAGLFSEELANAIGVQQEWNDLQQRDISQAAAGVYRRNYFIGMIERLSKAQEVLNGITDAAGYSQAENARTMDTLEKKYNSLKTAAQELAVSLGDAGLLDLLKSLTETAKNAADSFADIDPKMKALVLTALELLAAAQAIKAVGGLFGVEATLSTAVKALPGWTKLIPLILSAASAIGIYAYNSNAAYKQSIDDTTSLLSKQKQELDNTDDLIKKYEELKSKVELTSDEKNTLKGIEEQLANVYPNLRDKVDELTGSYEMQINKIKELSAERRKDLEQSIQIQADLTKAELDTQKAKGEAAKNQFYNLNQPVNVLESALEEIKSGGNAYEIVGRENVQQALEQFTKTDFWGSLGADIKAGFQNIFTLNPADKKIIEDQINESLKGLYEARAKIGKEYEEYQANADKYNTLLKQLEVLQGIRPEEDTETGTVGGGTGGASIGGVSTSTSKFDSKIDRYMILNAVLNDINNALSLNDTLQQQVDNSEKIRLTEQENNLLKQQQEALHAINEERRKEALELKNYLSSQGINFDESENPENYQARLKSLATYINSLGESTDAEKEAKKAATDRYNKVQDALDRYMQLIHTDIPKASNEWRELDGKIKDNQKSMDDLDYSSAESEIQHWAKIGVYSIQQQIDKYRELYSLQAESTEEQWKRDEKLFDLYKTLLDEQQKAIKDAYDERISKIEEETKVKKQAQQDIIDGIEDEENALDRLEGEHDYAQEMADLREQLAYWSVRTSEDARQKVADLNKQIAEKEHDHEVELQKQGLEDKKQTAQDEIDSIEKTANDEKEKLETSYKLIEKAFGEHSADIVARAAAMSKEAYQQWADNYLTPLQNALKSGSLSEFETSTGNLQESIGNLPSHDYGMSDADYRKFIANGEAWAAASAANKIKLQAANDALRTKYGIPAGEYPKFHTGAETLSYGIAMFKPGELVFPPSLSTDLKTLISVASGITGKSRSGDTYSTTDNRRTIKIDKLLNIENNHMEDEIDGDILSRELQRVVLSIE